MEEKKPKKTQMEDWREWRYQMEEKVATMADDRPPSPVVAQLMQDDREEPPEGLSPAQRANWFTARRMARMRDRRRHEDLEGFLQACLSWLPFSPVTTGSPVRAAGCMT